MISGQICSVVDISMDCVVLLAVYVLVRVAGSYTFSSGRARSFPWLSEGVEPVLSAASLQRHRYRVHVF